MQEIWKNIKGYEGAYQISNLGNVRSLDRYVKDKNRTQFIKGKRLKKGKRNTYYVISLNKNGSRKSYQIHRLVAEAFIPNPNNYPVVNHIDENRTNNRIENLEWCTQKYNINHSKRKMYSTKKAKVSSKTNEKYINIKNNKYRVAISQLKVEKYFSSLEEAIEFRNKKLVDLDNYYKKL